MFRTPENREGGPTITQEEQLAELIASCWAVKMGEVPYVEMKINGLDEPHTVVLSSEQTEELFNKAQDKLLQLCDGDFDRRARYFEQAWNELGAKRSRPPVNYDNK